MKARQILATALLAGVVVGGGVASAAVASATAITNNPASTGSVTGVDDTPTFWPRW